MRPLYQEIRMCDEIIQAEPGIRAMTIGLVQQRVIEEQKRRFRNVLENPRNTRPTKAR